MVKSKKGFTLLELAFSVFILTLIFGLFLSSSSFNRDFIKLKEASRKLNEALAISSYLSQQMKTFKNEFICAYGVYFSESTLNYETLAFTTTTQVCDLVATSTNFSNFIQDNILNKKYVHSNLEISSEILPKLALKGEEPNISVVFTDCSSTNPTTTPLIFLYFYSNTDLFFVAGQAGGGWQRIDVPYVCFNLSYRKDNIKIKVNRFGQFSLME